MHSFGDFVQTIINTGNRKKIFGYLINENDIQNSIPVTSDTNLLIYSKQFDGFFNDVSLIDYEFNLEHFEITLQKLQRRLIDKGETHYNLIIQLLQHQVKDGKIPNKSVLLFLNKLYKDYNY